MPHPIKKELVCLKLSYKRRIIHLINLTALRILVAGFAGIYYAKINMKSKSFPSGLTNSTEEANMLPGTTPFTLGRRQSSQSLAWMGGGGAESSQALIRTSPDFAPSGEGEAQSFRVYSLFNFFTLTHLRTVQNFKL